MSETLITCENVGKKFCRDLKKSLWYGVKDSAKDLFRRSEYFEANRERKSIKPKLRSGEFWANDGINFELKRGESLGLIGRNGAGKTTLLKMLNGLIKPDMGTISMRGQVAALIALGAGFNRILSGRENIYVNGSILGLSKRQISDRFESIVEFAELRDSIDSPVATYSSGMQVRLGFAVAANLIQPDILILDEVLAVGDIGFTIKCLNRTRELCAQSAVVFVSHNMQFVSSFCTRTIVMQSGQVVCDAEGVAAGIDAYMRAFPIDQQRSGTGQASISNIRIESETCRVIANEESLPLNQGESATVRFDLQVDACVPAYKIVLYIIDQSLTPIICIPILDSDGNPRMITEQRLSIHIPLGTIDLNMGKYSLIINVQEASTNISLGRFQGVGGFRVIANTLSWGFVTRPSQAIFSKT